MKLTQVNIFYTGNVQGVGFRYQCRAAALNMNVRGWVRNLPDGKVELLAQANKNMLINFIDAIDASFSDYIINKQVCWSDTVKEYATFDIAF